jgi:biotin carboxyl carrier protein
VAGTVRDVAVAVGDVVQSGDLIAVVEPARVHGAGARVA